LIEHPALQSLRAQLPSWQQSGAEGGLLSREPQQISGHPHLSVAIGPGTDADHRNRELTAHLPGQLVRHMLEHQREASGALELTGLAHQSLLRRSIHRLTPQAEAMHRLRRQPQVPHHRDAHAHQPINDPHHLRFGAFQLHGRGAGFLQQPPGSGHRCVLTALIAEKRQVGDEQGLLGRHRLKAALHGLRVVHHLLEGDRKGGGMPESHHSQRVTHQHGIGPGELHQGRRQAVPCGEHRDRSAVLLEADQIGWTHGVG
tara:strand:+ start:3196 stop:3969 length:774 start_codon:yes stop_codon:yes gene_type:complete